MKPSTEVSQLTQQQFFPIDFDHQHDDRLNSIEEQVNFLIDRITNMLHLGCGKVAIIYSANNDQALDVYTHYRCGEKIDRDIKGSGQAQLFGPLIREFYKKNLSDRVIILPVATTMEGGKYQPVSEREITRDINNIVSHLDSGYHVVALQNPSEKVRERGQRYLIGGGVADGFYTNQDRRMFFNDMALTQGRYIERVLNLLAVAYGGGVTAEEQKTHIHDLKTVLSAYQAMALTAHDDVMFGFLNARPLSLVHYISSGLVNRYILPSSHLGLVNATFDDQFNLLVSCDNEALCERVNDLLAQYRAKVITIKSKAHSPFVFQVDAEHVVDFLLKYCKVAVDCVRYFYAHKLSDKLDEIVVIVGDGIIFRSQKYSAQQFAKLIVDSKLDSSALHSLENLCTRESGALLKKYYRYNPVFKFNDDTYCRSFLSVIRDVKRTNKPFDGAVNKKIQAMIFWHYDLFTRRACHLFKSFDTNDIVQQNTEKFSEIGEYFSYLSKLIQDDVFSINTKSHENIERGFFKYWLYLQITHLAFQRGNMFIAFGLMNALSGMSSTFTPYLDAQSNSLYDQLKSALCASLQFEHLRKVIGESTYFQHQYGVSLPPIVFYLMWMDNGKEIHKSIERTCMITERLNPILSEISTLTVLNHNSDFYCPKGSNRSEFIRLLDRYSDEQLTGFCENFGQYSVAREVNQCIRDMMLLLDLSKNDVNLSKTMAITDRYDVFSGQKTVVTDLIAAGRVRLVNTALSYCLFPSKLLNKTAIDFVIDEQPDPIIKFQLKKCVQQFLSSQSNLKMTTLIRRSESKKGNEEQDVIPGTGVDRDSILIFDINSFIPADPLLQLIEQRVAHSPTKDTSNVMLLTKLDIAEYNSMGFNPHIQTRMKELIEVRISHLQAGSTILIPVNIDNMHFTTLAIRRKTCGGLYAVYIDTFGDFDQSANDIQKLCDKMGNIKLSCFTMNYQSNNDCAIHVELNCAILLYQKDDNFNVPDFITAMKNMQLDNPIKMTRRRFVFAQRVLKLDDISDYYQEVAITERLTNSVEENRPSYPPRLLSRRPSSRECPDKNSGATDHRFSK